MILVCLLIFLIRSLFRIVTNVTRISITVCRLGVDVRQLVNFQKCNRNCCIKIEIRTETSVISEMSLRNDEREI